MTTERISVGDAYDQLTQRLAHLESMAVLMQQHDDENSPKLQHGNHATTTYLHAMQTIAGDCSNLARALWPALRDAAAATATAPADAPFPPFSDPVNMEAAHVRRVTLHKMTATTMAICKEVIQQVDALDSAEGNATVVVIQALAGRGVEIMSAAMECVPYDNSLDQLREVLDHEWARNV